MAYELGISDWSSDVCSSDLYSALVLQGSQPFGADASLYDINARTLVNANIGVRSVDDRWRLSVWGKNIFNKYYWVNSTQAYDTFVRSTGRPAENGITLDLRSEERRAGKGSGCTCIYRW